MTKKLYLMDAYLRRCTAEVIDQTEVDGHPGFVIDQTVFYPASGGQPHDTGLIDQVPVIDVFENQDHQIIHVPVKSIQSARVTCEIDWERRFDHMQQHTGQHILSQVFLQSIHADTLSFHMGEQSATIDIDQAGLTSEKIIRVEQLANQIIFENRDVTTHTVDKDELDRFPIRKQTTLEDHIRIVEIKDFDYSPCGGTHCLQTGEIGILKIRRYENYKGGTRIHFVCGFRALKDYQNKSDVLKQLCRISGTAETDLSNSITRLKEDLKAVATARDHLTGKLLNHEADSLFSESQRHADIRVIKHLFTGRPQKEINLLAKKITDRFPGTVVLFGLKADGSARLLFQRSENLAFDMWALMQAVCPVIDGHGGGRPQQARGGGRAVEKLEDALESAEKMLLEMIG